MALRSARLRRALKWAGAATALLAIAMVACYWSSPALLGVDSGDCKAGALIVLGGDPYARPLRTAELFANHAAPLVIVSGNGDCEEVVRALKLRGVPEQVMVREDKSGTTRENAMLSVSLLRQRNITNAIVVTSWYHSRRALACFRKAAPEIRFYSRPSWYALERAQWSRTGVASHIRAEYLKLLGYWVCYGVCPF